MRRDAETRRIIPNSPALGPIPPNRRPFRPRRHPMSQHRPAHRSPPNQVSEPPRSRRPRPRRRRRDRPMIRMRIARARQQDQVRPRTGDGPRHLPAGMPWQLPIRQSQKPHLAGTHPDPAHHRPGLPPPLRHQPPPRPERASRMRRGPIRRHDHPHRHASPPQRADHPPGPDRLVVGMRRHHQRPPNPTQRQPVHSSGTSAPEAAAAPTRIAAASGAGCRRYTLRSAITADSG